MAVLRTAMAHLTSGKSMEAKQNGMVLRVATRTCFMIGFVSLLALFIGVGLLVEGHLVSGVSCLALGLFVFVYFCFQKITFEADSMMFHRPFLPIQRVTLPSVTYVAIVLIGENSGFRWRCSIMEGERLACELNPKLFSFAALDTIFDRIRAYSPNVVIDDGTRELRPKLK